LDGAVQLHLLPLGHPEEDKWEHEEMSFAGKISSGVKGTFVVTVLLDLVLMAVFF
jgi:hypothetical protein